MLVSLWTMILEGLSINPETKNTPQGMMRSVSLRKAVYDEFDGKGVAGFILATLIVYYILVAEKGQSIEEFVNFSIYKNYNLILKIIFTNTHIYIVKKNLSLAYR